MRGGFLSSFLVGDSNRGILNISHLLFADGTMVFCGANRDHISSLRIVLLCFEIVSKLKVNLAKLELVPVGGVVNIRSLLALWDAMYFFAYEIPCPSIGSPL